MEMFNVIEKLFWIGMLFLISFYFIYLIFVLIYSRNVRYNKNKIYIPFVSLVTPTYNEEDIIVEKIRNTVSINYPFEKMELIFVDSSNDGTRKKINEFKDNNKYNIVLLEENERKGLANALNLAYGCAHGEIVIKTDCDTFLERDSIKEIVSYFGNSRIGAVNGKLSIIKGSDTEKGYIDLIERIKLAESNFDSSYFFTSFSAFRKKLIMPIDSKSVADDGELALKIRKTGFKTIFVPDAIYYDEYPTDIKERLRQKSRRAEGHIKLICQNLDVLFNSKYGKFGMFIFPSNFFMMIISPWLILFLAVMGSFLLYKIFALIGIILVFFTLIIIIIIYIKSTPKSIAGFLEAQLSLVIGALNLVFKGPDFMWEKTKRLR